MKGLQLWGWAADLGRPLGNYRYSACCLLLSLYLHPLLQTWLGCTACTAVMVLQSKVQLYVDRFNLVQQRLRRNKLFRPAQVWPCRQGCVAALGSSSVWAGP